MPTINSWSCPWCSTGFWVQRTGYKDLESSTWSPNLIIEYQSTMLSGQTLPKYFPHIFKIRLSHKLYSHRKLNIQNAPLSFSAQPCAAFQYDSTWYSHSIISYHQASPSPRAPDHYHQWLMKHFITHVKGAHLLGPSLSSSHRKKGDDAHPESWALQYRLERMCWFGRLKIQQAGVKAQAGALAHLKVRIHVMKHCRKDNDTDPLLDLLLPLPTKHFLSGFPIFCIFLKVGETAGRGDALNRTTNSTQSPR